MSHIKPNLIYVFADQLRYRSVGYNGDTLAHTPNLNELSAECCILDNAVSGHPVCAPYRASLLTGNYTVGERGTGMVINEIRINPKSHRTIADVFNDSGYETCYIGKWHMYAAQLGNHFDPKNSYIPKGEDRLGFNDFFAGYNFHHKYYAPNAYYHLDSPKKIEVEGYEPDCQTDMAIERIRLLSQGEKPFALFLSLGTPHDPWDKDNVPDAYYKLFEGVTFPTPPNYRSKNDSHADVWARFLPFERKKLNDWQRAYYAMVANLDYNVGRLTCALKALGLEENTVLVFTSDHGEMFGAQGRRAKNIFYDEAVRVPFLVKYGTRLPKGKNEVCINTVDVMPTLLNLMGLEAPTVDGTDKSAALQSPQKQDDYTGCLLMGTGPTAVYGNGFEWRGYRTARYTYAVYRRDGKEYLFDNLDDEYQTRNLAKNKEYKECLVTLKEKMYAEMARIGDDFENNGFYKKHWIKNRAILQKLPRRKDIK